MAESLDFEGAMLLWREFENGHWGVRGLCEIYVRANASLAGMMLGAKVQRESLRLTSRHLRTVPNAETLDRKLDNKNWAEGSMIFISLEMLCRKHGSVDTVRVY